MSVIKQVCGDGENYDHHKIWTNIAYFTATLVFAKIGWYAQPSDSLSMLFLVYIGAVGGSQIANTFVAGRFGNGANGKPPEHKGEGS